MRQAHAKARAPISSTVRNAYATATQTGFMPRSCGSSIDSRCNCPFCYCAAARCISGSYLPFLVGVPIVGTRSCSCFCRRLGHRAEAIWRRSRCFGLQFGCGSAPLFSCSIRPNSVVVTPPNYIQMTKGRRHLTNRWSARVGDKVPSSYNGARAAQLKR